MKRAMQAVSHCQPFKVQPETFNGIEKRTVFGQPDHQNTVLVEAQSRLYGFTAVVGGVIHHQNEMLPGILLQQMFQELDKGITVFLGVRDIADPPGVPVISTEDM